MVVGCTGAFLERARGKLLWLVLAPSAHRVPALRDLKYV
jgi:hypothetical protein